MRWVAMAGVLVAMLVAAAGLYPGVEWRVLGAVVVLGTAYNFVLWRGRAVHAHGKRAAVLQALVDLVLLTVVLWAAGGISCPFIGFYIFHVALIAILGGPWATLVASAAAFAGAGFLALSEVIPVMTLGVWDPSHPWDTVADVVAFVTTLAAAAYVVTHAVQELRDREQTLARARQEMIAAERQFLLAERLASLGRVAQGVAHELNTPLATIRTLAADMRTALSTGTGDQELLSDIGESARLIHDETERLGRITHALLAGGDLQRPRLEHEVDLLQAVERAKALVFAGVRDGPKVTVDPNLAPLRAKADPDRVVQILVNLLQNALDATRESGGQHVLVSGAKRNGALELIVQDDGPGLGPEIQARLFEPFATTKPVGEGTGLGLYASYMLVQTMGGDLTLENVPGGGACARVTLPVKV